MEGPMASAVRRFTARVASVLTPGTSTWVVIGAVAWLLVRPFLHLGSVIGAVVDTLTTLTVLLVAILLEARRGTSGRGKAVGAPVSGSPPPA